MDTHNHTQSELFTVVAGPTQPNPLTTANADGMVTENGERTGLCRVLNKNI